PETASQSVSTETSRPLDEIVAVRGSSLPNWNRPTSSAVVASQRQTALEDSWSKTLRQFELARTNWEPPGRSHSRVLSVSCLPVELSHHLMPVVPSDVARLKPSREKLIS